MRILVVEDEKSVVEFIKKGLEEQGYDVDVAYDGFLGKKLATERDYDLILLDIILPKIDGLQVCREIRAINKTVPILMLTALSTTEDKIAGLDIGADDYLVKPFQFTELLARIRALLRRQINKTTTHTYGIADLRMDTITRTVTRRNSDIKLTAREFKLLEIFLKNQGKVLTRADIGQEVWEISFDPGTNVIDVYVNYLRSKIDKGFEPKLIHTVIGIGYVLKEE